MPALDIDFLFVIGVGVLASLIGWWLRGILVTSAAARNSAPMTMTAPSIPATEAPDAGPAVSSEAFHAREALISLHDLTKSVATNVGKHQSQVSSINEEIKAAGNVDSSALAAVVSKLIEANERVQNQLVTRRKGSSRHKRNSSRPTPWRPGQTH